MSKAPPRDFVRFSPIGFSMAVAVVILIAAGGFAAGYLWGIRSERVRASAAAPATVIIPPLDFAAQTAVGTPSGAGSGPAVTFYSELAGDTKSPPASALVKTPQQALPSRKEASQGTGTAPRKEPSASKPSPTDAQVRPQGKSVPSAQPKGLMVQVASYPDIAQANELKRALEREGYQCEIQEADLGPRGHWFRVRLGPFPDEPQARKAMARIQRERAFKGYIVP